MLEAFLTQLHDRSAQVSVIGQGYVGLSLACAAAERGFSVHCYDVDQERIAALADGRNVVPGVLDSTFDGAFETGKLHFSTDIQGVADSSIVAICVPTPVHEHRPDLRFIESAGQAVAPLLQRGSLVILESTTYPGTTEELLRPILETSGLRAGEDFMLAYSPERIDPGNPKFGMTNTPRVAGGMGPAARTAAHEFYDVLVDEVVSVSSCRAAEMAKLLENTFRMVNIALVNELATLCSEQGINVWEVIHAAASKPFGFMPFYPGPGVGGHCIPLDPTYLAWQSRRDTGRPFRLVETAQDINAAMPTYVVSRVTEALNEAGKSLKGAKILVLGVTYKPDVGDIRESAALHVVDKLHKKGADVTFFDPFVDHLNEEGLDLHGEPELTKELIERADLVALITPHQAFDLDFICAHARLVFDARNAIAAQGVSLDTAQVVAL